MECGGRCGLERDVLCLPRPGPEEIKKIHAQTQLSTKFFQLINVKMPATVGILIFISGENQILG